MINDKSRGIDITVLYDVNGESHVHQELELLYVLEGEINVTVEAAVSKMRQGDILLINSMKSHNIHRVLNVEKKSLVCCIHLSYKTLCEYTGSYRMLYWCNSMKDTDNAAYNDLRQILDHLLMDYANGDKKQYFYRYSQYYQLLHYLVNYFLIMDEQLQDEGRKGQEEARLADITNYLELNYNRDVTLQELSDHLFLSPSYLSKYLKRKLGTNYMKYLYSIRMQHAVGDLLYTDKQVTHIALDHGFPSAAMFNKQFKEQYDMTPSAYRLKMKTPAKDSVLEQQTKAKKSKQVDEQLKRHFSTRSDKQDVKSHQKKRHFVADMQEYQEYQPTWSRMINVGAAAELLNSSVQEAVKYAAGHLKLESIRFWSIFAKEMHVVGKNQQYNFRRLDQILSFLVEQRIRPVIELGEKPKKILISANEFLLESENITEFASYDDFLHCLEAMMAHVTDYFGREDVEQWGFELWEDRRIEVYSDKRPYLELFKDCSRIIKRYAPAAKVGGSGNHLGWFKAHTEETIRKWIDGGIYPDYLTYTYFPYALGELQQERFSRRKSDENDLQHAVDELRLIMRQYGFPNLTVYITEWNMTISSRNYFNDSLWKGCYVIKSYLDTLGKVDGLSYIQLLDNTTEFYDSQKLLNGSSGILTSELIEKPAFQAMRMMAHLRKYLVGKGENYIITRDDNGSITIIVHNFIGLNYLYYMKDENENTVAEHYNYFEHQEGQHITLELSGLNKDGNYLVRQYTVNQEYGSVMDEWKQLSYIEMLKAEDVEYMKRSCRPKMTMAYMQAEQGRILLDLALEPLEFRRIALYPVK